MPTIGCTKLGCENINLVSYNHSICKLISSSRKYGIVWASSAVARLWTFITDAMKL